ncbi:MAG: 16S rRNA (guanine(966)-N(2))-methyltransferase RsmD [Shimia sp.]
MRIIGGRLRGLRLAAVGKGDPGAALRPTSDRVRESLFNVLTHRVDFDAGPVLDLFAGTGALGIEALSRGAPHATFVESGRVGQRLIRENLVKARLGNEHFRLLTGDARRLPQAEGAAHLIFLDPPYGRDLGGAALASAVAGGWVAPGALVVWEEAVEMAAPGFDMEDVRRYGETVVTLLRAAG